MKLEEEIEHFGILDEGDGNQHRTKASDNPTGEAQLGVVLLVDYVGALIGFALGRGLGRSLPEAPSPHEEGNAPEDKAKTKG
jgi:hypothetical protein